MTQPSNSRSFRAVLSAVVGVGFVMLLDQASELAISLYPYKFSDAAWRFGAFGLGVSKASGLVLADALLAMAALGFDSRAGLRIWAAVHLVAAVAMFVMLAAFGLDLLQLHRAVRPEASRAFILAGGRAALVATSLMMLWFWAAIAGLRSTQRGGHRKDDAGLPFLVSGQTPRG